MLILDAFVVGSGVGFFLHAALLAVLGFVPAPGGTPEHRRMRMRMRLGLAALSLYATFAAWAFVHKTVYAPDVDATARMVCFMTVALPTGVLAFVVPLAVFFYRRHRTRRRSEQEDRLRRETWARQRREGAARDRAFRDNLPRPKRRRNGRRRRH